MAMPSDATKDQRPAMYAGRFFSDELPHGGCLVAEIPFFFSSFIAASVIFAIERYEPMLPPHDGVCVRICHDY
jgi:hypothetical protein